MEISLDAITLLRDQAAKVDDLMRQVFESVDADSAIWQLEGSTANPIAVSFLHAYAIEDWAVHVRFQAKPTIFENGGWRERLSFDPNEPWTPGTRPDPEECRRYAAEVRAATVRYLDRITSEDLDRPVETARGKQPAAQALSVFLIIHKATHMGEISALLGCQGIKGFPI
jgi:hypothetical protein